MTEIWVIKRGKDENKDLFGTVDTFVNVSIYLSHSTKIFKLLKTGRYEFLPIITNIVGIITTLFMVF